MKPWPKRAPAMYVCGVLALLAAAYCLYAYQKARPREMAKFHHGRLSLTVEEVPRLIFPEHFFPGGPLLFDYRFTLILGNTACSSFTLYGESSRFNRAAELKPEIHPNLHANEKTLFACVLDEYRDVVCSGAPFREIHWRAGVLRPLGPQNDTDSTGESGTFLDDPVWRSEEKK